MIRVEAKGMEDLARLLRLAPKKVIILTKRALEAGMQQIKGSIQLGGFFDHPTPELQTAIWADKAKVVGDVVEVEGGWAHEYGPVLEFGVTPEKQGGWPIVAKWAPFLRFRVGDSIVRVKEVWHDWSEDQMRPHWEPTIKEKWPGIQAQLDQIPAAALRDPR